MRDRARLAIEIGDHATGLADEQDSRGYVPRGERHFPECLEAAAGDVGEIERRGAGAPDAGSLKHYPRQELEVTLGVRVARLERQPGADECTGRVADLRHGDRL